MATGIGSNSDTKTVIPASINVASAATTVLAVVPTGFAGFIDLQHAIGAVTTAFSSLDSNETLTLQYTASGGSAVTVAVMTVGTEVSATAAVGTLAAFAVSTGKEQGLRLAAGDALQVVVANADTTNDAGVINLLLPVNLWRL